MNNLSLDLIKARILSFIWSVFAFLLTGVAGLLLSADFQAIVAKHWGTGVSGMLVLMLVTEVAKHLRNLRVVGKMRAQHGLVSGSSSDDEFLRKSTVLI